MVEQFYVLILCFQVSNPFLVCSYPQFPFGGLHVVIIVNNDFFLLLLGIKYILINVWIPSKDIKFISFIFLILEIGCICLAL